MITTKKVPLEIESGFFVRRTASTQTGFFECQNKNTILNRTAISDASPMSIQIDETKTTVKLKLL
jgi:hypothetical protein